ncbi:MAG: PepSY-like domain-containing protein [Paludibacter sp.]|nr:PepSY-like domain-containing protein [Paludibacter sp.]
MTKSFFIFIAVAMLSAVLGTACAKNKVISANDLPKTSQEFLKNHFPDAKVSLVTKEWNEYNVWLDNGFEVNFTRKGEWDEVDGKTRPVPQSVINLLPAAVASYVSAHFPNAQIVSVNREPFGYDVDLSNGMDLTFDYKGNIREIDD